MLGISGSGVTDIRVRLISVLSLQVLQGSRHQQEGHVGIHISDNLPQLEVVGPHTTDRDGMDCHGTAPSVHNWRSSDHGRRQHNLHLVDAHSAGAHCRDFQSREGAKAQYVVMSDGNQTTQRADLGILHKVILGTRGTEERRLVRHLGRPSFARAQAGPPQGENNNVL